jgi:hypothetical protein
MFAELVASGMVPLDVATGVTFRSELARGARGEARTPGSGRARRGSASASAGAPPPGAPGSPGYALRAHTPSDAPTAYAPNAAVQAGAYGAPAAGNGERPAIDDALDVPPRRSRKGLVAVALVAVFGGGIAAAVALGGGEGKGAIEASAGSASTVIGSAVASASGSGPEAGSGSASATGSAVGSASASAAGSAAGSGTGSASASGAGSAAGSDAVAASGADPAAGSGSGSATASDPAVATRTVKLTINVKNAKLLVDGAAVPIENGVATLDLTDGSHQLEVSAAGRAPLRETFEVSADKTKLALHLERARSGGAQSSTKKAPGTTPSPGGATHKDDTIDPFK